MINRKIKLMTFMMVLISLISAQTISVQGVLRDPLGKTVEDGYYNLTLKLYEELAGGIEIWQESQSSVYTIHGVFSLDLGSVNSLNNVPFNTTYYLGISVDGDPEMDPRLKLLKVPSALSVVGTQNIIPSSGNAGIGTMNPQAGLHIVADGAGDDLLKIENEAGKTIRVDPSGNLYLESGGVLKFEDGSQLNSADFGGTVASVVTDGDAIITADEDGNGSGRIKFYSGDSLQMVIDHSGVSVAGKTNFGFPTGTTIMFTGAVAPSGWLLCDGNEYSTIEYADLFAVIDILYGAGFGTFKVPDMRSRHIMGYDETNAHFNEVGKTGGEETHSLIESELPNHNHSVDMSTAQVAASGSHRHTSYARNMYTWEVSANHPGNMQSLPYVHSTLQDIQFPYAGDHRHDVDFSPWDTDPKGGDATHNILHPYATVNYIIKY
ncbi:MAG: tail fiber protein [Candidatus Marinimicrobia bacterium]|nr:tail fiber protein [Candidatus Neomarinimicrobiota bacterium]